MLKQFIIEPIDLEIKKGFLFPGHRFFFLSSLEDVSTIRLYADSKGIRRKTVLVDSLDIAPLVSLLDEEDLIDCLTSSVPAAGDAGSPGSLNLRVFNMSTFYRVHHFQPGDWLILTPLQEPGSYSVSYVPGEERPDQSVAEKWVKKFDKTVNTVLEEHILISPEELLDSCFLQSPALKQSVPGELAQLLQNSESFQMWFEQYKTDCEELSEIDDFLAQLELGLNEVAVQAMIRDTFFHHENSPDLIMNRIFQGKADPFPADSWEAAFRDLLVRTMKEAKGDYNIFQDQQTGRIREETLVLVDALISWLRQLDELCISPEDLPSDEMEQFLQISHLTDSILVQVMEPQVLSEEELGETLNHVQKLAEKQELLMDNILFPEYHPPVLTVKMTLLRSKTPIWRRLRLPGDCTLRDLHTIIQAAMGWFDEHLHMFTDEEKVRYVSTDNAGGVEEDENRYKLDELLDRKGRTLKYVYDFGDNWQVKILLEKIEEYQSYSSDEADAIVCLAGKGAAPPEDCGGIPGLRYMVENGCTPEGDPFDADEFDPEKVTRVMEGI